MSKKFIVIVDAATSIAIEVEAENPDEAREQAGDKAYEMLKSGEFQLRTDDLTDEEDWDVFDDKGNPIADQPDGEFSEEC